MTILVYFPHKIKKLFTRWIAEVEEVDKFDSAMNSKITGYLTIVKRKNSN